MNLSLFFLLVPDSERLLMECLCLFLHLSIRLQPALSNLSLRNTYLPCAIQNAFSTIISKNVSFLIYDSPPCSELRFFYYPELIFISSLFWMGLAFLIDSEYNALMFGILG